MSYLNFFKKLNNLKVFFNESIYSKRRIIFFEQIKPTGLFFAIYIFFTSTIYASEKNIIYIYEDKGVSRESLIQTISTFKSFANKKYIVKTINAEKLKQGTWTQNTKLFIMPGGADLPYVKYLSGKGNKVIKRYVEEGGTFLGICAGSYYASSYVEFDKNGSLEVMGDRELAFFSGKAIGPVLAPYDYKTQSGSRAAKIFTIFPQMPEVAVYYNGGGFFEGVNGAFDTKIIATYENSLPAIILINYGRGRVLLSGVHFEYDPHLLDSNDVYIQKIVEMLNNSNNSRKILFKHLMQIIGL